MNLFDETVDSGFVDLATDRLIRDNAYASDGLGDRHDRMREVQKIAPHRRNRRLQKRKDAEASEGTAAGAELAVFRLASKFQAVDCALGISCG